MAFAIKADLTQAAAPDFVFPETKTMYGGKHVAAGDTVFIFTGQQGLVARGVVASAEAVAPIAGRARQTPRVSLTVRRTALARRALGRQELKGWTDWNDGRPESELNFKFYRQTTDKLVGVSDATAGFLETFF